MPPNGDLKQLGGTFSPCRADHTELLAVRTCGTVRAQARPATGRDREGAAIELGVWALAPQQFGTFVAAIPPPLGIGTILLADETSPKGFRAESVGLEGAAAISALDGGRAYAGSVTR
jgi:allophanate hydrolase